MYEKKITNTKSSWMLVLIFNNICFLSLCRNNYLRHYPLDASQNRVKIMKLDFPRWDDDTLLPFMLFQKNSRILARRHYSID